MIERAYRFGFVTTTALGNASRYETLRKYASRAAEEMNVECVWAPVKHYRNPEPFPFLPTFLQTRLASHEQMGAVRREWANLDAVLFHYNEPYMLEAMKRPRHGTKTPLLIWASDAPPNADPDRYPVYTKKPTPRQRRFRLGVDRYCADRTDYFFPWSTWSARQLADGCRVEAARMTVISQYLDLETWQHQPHPDNPVPRILFVGGDFERKGGDDLLQVFAERFVGRAELHLVTRPQARELPPGVFVHTGLTHETGALQDLVARADFFVLPTRADFSSIATAEAMATGRAVIVGDTGGVADLVRPDETGFLIAPGDRVALAERMETLLTDVALRRRMGDAARVYAARELDAAVNSRRLLEAMIQATNRVRGARSIAEGKV